MLHHSLNICNIILGGENKSVALILTIVILCHLVFTGLVIESKICMFKSILG
jgi:hypothetical protein